MTRATADVVAISETIRAHMRGRSWHDSPECPRFEDLRLLDVPHYDFDGALRRGELIVHASVALEVATIFEQLLAVRFPIASLRRIDHWSGDDDASMAANNSSGFNFRVIQGTTKLSWHALGLAIDLNPVQNPWLRGQRVDPPQGRDFLDRAARRPGMLVRPSPAIDAFEQAGWQWGGDAESPDYHHFDKALPSP